MQRFPTLFALTQKEFQIKFTEPDVESQDANSVHCIHVTSFKPRLNLQNVFQSSLSSPEVATGPLSRARASQVQTVNLQECGFRWRFVCKSRPLNLTTDRKDILSIKNVEKWHAKQTSQRRVLSFWSPFWKTSSLSGKAVVFIISKNCQKLSNSWSLVYNFCCTPPHAQNSQGKGQSTPCHGEAFAEHQGAEQTSLRWAIRESHIARPPKH